MEFVNSAKNTGRYIQEKTVKATLLNLKIDPVRAAILISSLHGTFENIKKEEFIKENAFKMFHCKVYTSENAPDV